MGSVVGLSKCANHEFSKAPADSLRLIEGEGVEGDAHRGVTVKHRSRVKADPTQPNLRQVHLIHFELIEQLQQQGFRVKPRFSSQPGTLGENITTLGIDLLALPTGTILQIGSNAKVKITGLRNPCSQLANYQKGLMAAVLDRDDKGKLISKSGVMGIVLLGGVVRTNDRIEVNMPPEPHESLERV